MEMNRQNLSLSRTYGNMKIDLKKGSIPNLALLLIKATAHLLESSVHVSESIQNEYTLGKKLQLGH